MSANSNMPYKEAIISEYANVRAEILQLNGQIFTILTGSLALNLTILGWMFSKDDPSKYLYLPTIGVITLFVGCLMLLNRNRLAHRLAIFQKEFIENRIPDICWGRVYFQYRDEYSKQEKGLFSSRFSSWSERIAESGVYVLSVIQFVNLIIFVLYAILPWITSGSTKADWLKVANLLVMVIVLIIEYVVAKRMTDYSAIFKAMNKVLNSSSMGIQLTKG